MQPMAGWVAVLPESGVLSPTPARDAIILISPASSMARYQAHCACVMAQACAGDCQTENGIVAFIMFGRAPVASPPPGPTRPRRISGKQTVPRPRPGLVVEAGLGGPNFRNGARQVAIPFDGVQGQNQGWASRKKRACSFRSLAFLIHRFTIIPPDFNNLSWRAKRQRFLTQSRKDARKQRRQEEAFSRRPCPLNAAWFIYSSGMASVHEEG